MRMTNKFQNVSANVFIKKKKVTKSDGSSTFKKIQNS